MANPLDQVTQDLRDDEGRPLRRIIITGADAPVDNSEIGTGDNRLMRAVAPEPAQGNYDVLSLIKQVKDYLAGTVPGVLNEVGVAGVEPGPVRDAAITGRNSLAGLAGPENDLWPVRMLKSGATLPGEVSQGIVPVIDPETGRTSGTVIERAMDTGGLMVPGGLAQKPGSATLGSGPIRQGAAAVPAEAPVFYSALEHAVTNAGQDTMSPQQWQGWLKNQPGLKAEEIGWTGLGDWLARQKGKVSKEDVKAYLDEHKVEIEDVTKSSEGAHVTYDQVQAAERNAQRTGNWEPFEELQTQFEAQELNQLGDTKYSSYQLPGGENYREHLLTLPPRGVTPEQLAAAQAAERKAGYAYDSYLDRMRDKYDPYRTVGANWKDSLTPAEQAKFAELQQAAIKSSEDLVAAKRGKDGRPAYHSSHWDEPNVLAHVRTNERDVGGVPSLHIEEIQSDWHQQGRKQGYKGSNSPEAIAKAQQEAGDARSEFTNHLAEKLKLKPAEIDAAIYHARDRGQIPSWVVGSPKGEELAAVFIDKSKKYNDMLEHNKVPDAPFKTSWPELALKRMIRLAAEEGKTRISWTPGEAQAARYDLSNHVKDLSFQQNVDGTYNMWGATKDGGNHRFGQDIPKEKLADYVGKDVAEKIVNHKDPEAGKLSGVDLKVGGEGMKGFYDNMLPKMVEKLGKAHGVKVKKAQLPSDRIRKTADDRYTIVGDKRTFDTLAEAEKVAGQPVHYFDIPPAWRDQAVGKGFPLYMQGIPFPLTPVDYDPFKEQ